jgi:drug/metabolite transporter (DMT)-like permease
MGVFVGLLCALTWASGSIMMRDLARKLDPFTLNAPRTLIGGLAMFLLAATTGRTAGYRDVSLEQLLFLLGSVGIGGGLGDSFYVLSLNRIGVSRAFPIASTYPALTLAFGMLFLHEQISLSVFAGLALVLGGILLISRLPRGMRLASPQQMSASGVTFALLAAVGWAISMILIAPGIAGLDEIMVASFRTPALSLLLWGLVAVRGTAPKLRTLSRRDWVILMAGGLIGWGLGSVLFLLSVSLLGAARAAILTSTSPLFALPLSALFLKEKAPRSVLVGTLLTVAGIIVVS